MTKSLFNLPKKYKRLKCKLPQNYQCGGKCQPARFNCKKTVKGVPKSALDWLKYVEERKARVSAINDRQQGSRSRLEVDDLGFVKRVGRSVDFNRRKAKVDGDVIPQIDLHLFLQPGDKVVTKENRYSKEKESIVDGVKTKTFMAKDLKGKYMAWTVPIDNIQSVTRGGKIYSVEKTGDWTNYIEDGIKNGTLDWEKFNLKEKFPSLYKLYGKPSKPGRLSTEKRERKKIEFKVDLRDNMGQLLLVDTAIQRAEERLPSLLKKAKQWATNLPNYPQISRQKRKLEATRKLLKKENGLNEWISSKVIAYKNNPFSNTNFDFPSIEKEEAILSAMMGDGGKKLKEKYPVFLQEMENIYDSIHREGQEFVDDKWGRDHEDFFNTNMPLTSVFGIKLTGNHDKDLPLVKAAYRKAAKETHPDTGGNDAAFRKVNDEWERYLKTLPTNYSEPYLLYLWN